MASTMGGRCLQNPTHIQTDLYRRKIATMTRHTNVLPPKVCSPSEIHFFFFFFFFFWSIHAFHQEKKSLPPYAKSLSFVSKSYAPNSKSFKYLRRHSEFVAHSSFLFIQHPLLRLFPLPSLSPISFFVRVPILALDFVPVLFVNLSSPRLIYLSSLPLRRVSHAHHLLFVF
jgi:hypothetical protein